MFQFSVLNYCAFAPALHTKEDWQQWAKEEKTIGQNHGETPDISFIPPLLRRRLSQNIKMAMYVADGANNNKQADIKTVFASRFGEWQHSIKLLLEYYNEHTISPLGFGLSVHNAGAGLYSLVTKNTAAYTALAATDATFSMGFIEALITLQKTDSVLYIYSDEAAPELYKDTWNAPPFAIGLLLGKKPINDLRCFYKNTGEEDTPLDFLRFLLSDINSYSCKKLHMEKNNG